MLRKIFDTWLIGWIKLDRNVIGRLKMDGWLNGRIINLAKSLYDENICDTVYWKARFGLKSFLIV